MDKKETKNIRYALSHNDYFIKRTSSRFLFNSIISMVFLYIGSLIDTLLVGLYLGDDGLAAMSLVSPVYLVYYTVGATIGIGASINASRVLGTGNIAEYRKTFSLASISLAFAAVIMTLCSYIFIDDIMKLICGNVSGVRLEMAKQYLLYYIPGGAMTLLSYIPLYFLKTEGKPKYSSRLFTMSAVINVILSWLFMSPVFNMGTAGASLATSISFLSVVIVGFAIMLRGRTELRFVRGSFSKTRIKEIIVSGIPNGLSNLLESARILLINMLIIYTGASAMLTCYTVVRNVGDVLNSVIIGISSALIPLIGVFFGERNYEDERVVFKRSMKFGIIIMGILTVAVCLVPGQLCMLFGVSDETILQEGRWAIPLSSIGLVAAYANTLYISYLTTIEKEGIATVLVVLRLFVMLAAFALPLALLTGVRGIWLSLSLSEIATYLVFCIIRAVIMKNNPSIDKYLLDTDMEITEDINFSIKNDVQEIVTASEKISVFCEDSGVDTRRTMKVSLAIEEILTFLLTHCLGEDKENYVAVRVCKINQEVMVRFRYVGKIYNPMDYYSNNADNEELSEELLGLKMMMKSARLVDFRQTLGANNLMFMF